MTTYNYAFTNVNVVATLAPGEATIVGTRNGLPVNRTFHVGDTAATHGENVVYTGRITSITGKTVTIDNGRKVFRHDAMKFAVMNYRDFDNGDTLAAM